MLSENEHEPAEPAPQGAPRPDASPSFARRRAGMGDERVEPGRLKRRARGVHSFFTRDLWARELATLPTFRRWAYGFARVAQLTVANFVKDRCTWRAAALTYITILSLVPMLALGFSVAKGMGAYEQLEHETIVPFLDSTFGPPATPAAEVSVAMGAEAEAPPEGGQVRGAIDTLLDFVKRTDVSKLGALGFLIVMYTVIKLLGAIELSFNDIWGVRKSRSLPRKVADYFSTVVLVPLLLVTGTTLTKLARAGYLGGDGAAQGEGGFLAGFGSLAVVWLGFGFAYLLMPNTRTRLSSALVGAMVGGSMWQLFQWAHLELQVGVANYNAIYSTFAALPIFLFWVHSSWMTVLLGAEAAAAHQNQANHGQMVRSRDYDLAQKELLALRLVARVTRNFVRGLPPRTREELVDELGCPESTMREVTASLETAGLLVATEEDQDGGSVVLAADPGAVRIQDVLDGLKGASLGERDAGSASAGTGVDPAVDRAFGRFRDERDAGRSNITLRELVERV